MPMPDGLLPVGNMVGAATSKPSAAAASGIPKPSLSIFNREGYGTQMLQKQYEPLSWSDFFAEKDMVDGLIPVYTAGTEGHVLFCIHGAGHSAMSFARLTDFLKEKYTVVAWDQRGHGEHRREDET